MPKEFRLPPAPRARARFCPLSVARVVLGVTEAVILEMIRDGQLKWVLNVEAGTGAAPSLRLWHPGVIGQWRRDPLPNVTHAGGVIESVFPAARADFPAMDVAVSLSCPVELVHAHLAAGRLAGGADKITRASLAEFLTRGLTVGLP